MRGEAGIGKTALMQYCARQASGCRVEQIAGVESELEMPFAALHQLCGPMLGGIDALPAPQQQALLVAFGLAAGSAPDRFLMGLAVLGLLAEAAVERPLVCLVDDAQWLDEPSRQVLAFVGRRLQAESVVVLLAVRESEDDRAFPALKALTLEGLSEKDARALLTAAVPGKLDPQVRDRIIAETRGNPLRLLELPWELSPGERAGGFAAPRPSPASAPLEEHYKRRIEALPGPARQLMLVAAADATGDATLVWRAAQLLGVGRSAAEATDSAQLLEIGARTRFRHPLVRSAAYAAGTVQDRRTVHAALAEATDARADSARRVWHLACATEGPDEEVASQLEQAAVAAQARAGSAAAAALLQRCVELTAEPKRRAERALAAAQTHLYAGAFDAALASLAEARAVATDDVQRARAEHLKGQVFYRLNPGPDAPAVLLEAARTLETLDSRLARQTYLDAWMTSFAVGARAQPGSTLPEVSEAILSAPPATDGAPPSDLFVDGLALAVRDGVAAAPPMLQKAIAVFVSDEVSDEDVLEWGHIAQTACCIAWDSQSWDVLSTKAVAAARVSGALAPLSIAPAGRGCYAVWCVDVEAAIAIIAEFAAINEATGIGWFAATELLHAAYQGRPESLIRMAADVARFTEHGLGLGALFATYTQAILCNGLGRYADALKFAEHAAFEMEIPDGTAWSLPEVIEAAVRDRRPEVAQRAMEQLPKYMLQESDWASGIEARSRALVTDGEEVERWYVEALQRLGRTPFRTELGRAHLLYGEWLRREGRRVDAREQLNCAYDMFSAIGAVGFTERTRWELLATGEKVRKRDPSTRNDLTAQEEHIARLARDGRTNAEIGAELFLSGRTVEWHLRKVFQKLGVSSRKDLKDVLPSRGPSTDHEHELAQP